MTTISRSFAAVAQIIGTGDAFVTLVEGSFSNVVGLPVEMVVEMLAEQD